jgi:hypothetical protein
VTDSEPKVSVLGLLTASSKFRKKFQPLFSALLSSFFSDFLYQLFLVEQKKVGKEHLSCGTTRHATNLKVRFFFSPLSDSLPEETLVYTFYRGEVAHPDFQVFKGQGQLSLIQRVSCHGFRLRKEKNSSHF